MIDGLVVVDKPTGMTSHDVVSRCRRIFGQRRIGHAGTLDPGATGVLLVALGRATRLMRYVSELSKSYTGEVVLGRTTTTLDDEGETVGEFEMSGVTLEDVSAVATKFVGEIEQIPPMVSAVKVNGRRLHELARSGIEVERAARRVTVHSLGVEETDDSCAYRIDVCCSSGTYVRTLAADIGEALGGGAHLRRLRRTAIGQFDTSQAHRLEELEVMSEGAVLAPHVMVSHLDRLEVDATLAASVSHGVAISMSDIGEDRPWNQGSSCAVVDEAGRLLAVYEMSGEKLRPTVVLESS